MTINSESVGFKVPQTIDALICGALHMLIRHCDEIRLLWIYDIALLAQKLVHSNEWIKLQNRSQECEARLGVEIALNMAQNWTEFKIPLRFRNFNQWPKPNKIEKNIVRDALLYKQSRPDIVLKLYLSDSVSIFQKFRTLRWYILPNADIIRNCYPTSSQTSLFFLHMRRWGRWTLVSLRHFIHYISY